MTLKERFYLQPYWMRGAIIGSIFSLILIVILYIFELNFITYLFYPALKLGSFLVDLIGQGGLGDIALFAVVGSSLMTLQGFFLGILIGYIFQKIKNPIELEIKIKTFFLLLIIVIILSYFVSFLTFELKSSIEDMNLESQERQTQEAIEKEDVSLCGSLEKPMDELCYLSLAEITLDTSICDKQVRQIGFKEECLEKISDEIITREAETNLDVTVCNKTLKVDCVLRVSVLLSIEAHDPTKCNVANGWSRDVCLGFYAYYIGDPSVCDEYATKYGKAYCDEAATKGISYYYHRPKYLDK